MFQITSMQYSTVFYIRTLVLRRSHTFAFFTEKKIVPIPIRKRRDSLLPGGVGTASTEVAVLPLTRVQAAQSARGQDGGLHAGHQHVQPQ